MERVAALTASAEMGCGDTMLGFGGLKGTGNGPRAILSSCLPLASTATGIAKGPQVVVFFV